MPMFRESLDLQRHRSSSPAASDRSASQPIPIQAPNQASRRLSEESIRTELCEGPLPDSPVAHSPAPDEAVGTSDRAELIERLKRGESPTWIPNRHLKKSLESGQAEHRTRLPATDDARHLESLFHRRDPLSPTSSRSPRPASDAAPSLLPAVAMTDPQVALVGNRGSQPEERLQDGLSIERPRSALHSGDFTQNDGPYPGGRQARGAGVEGLRGSRARDPHDGFPASWLATSPPGGSNAVDIGSRSPLPRQTDAYASGCFGLGGSCRSALSSFSSSFSTSFAYKHPTSPLVQSESNDDMDFSMAVDKIDIGTNITRNPRRHTLNSHDYTLPSLHKPAASPHPAGTYGQATGLRREGSHAYQAHQPRRSLTSIPNFPPLTAEASPGTPAFMRARRPSFGSDASPLQHASMVGSYEESILRGRMSTTPSKPLDFLAQIGVLGIGKCKPSLRCPPHVTLPFSAVFYSYSSTSHGRSKPEDGPSPYVGMIDLENGLANQGGEASRARRKMQSRSLARRAREDPAEDVCMGGGDLPPPEAHAAAASDAESPVSTQSKRRSTSPKAPPGGSYRIPAKGQLQIIIKNQNKTAVKLFLVPYDLTGMDPGTKTFIRQRIFSGGHAVDAATLSGIPDDNPEQPRRQILRYLIHLHICCPSKGRYYLYKSVRVVFANRVPDGKEKLRNEVTFPEPRFSAYKPIRVMHPPAAQVSGPGALLAADKAFRRRSSGFMIGSHFPAGGFEDLGGVSRSLQTSSIGGGDGGSARTARMGSVTSAAGAAAGAAGAAPTHGSPSFFGLSAFVAGTAAGTTTTPGHNTPIEPIPFRLPRNRLASVTSDGSDATTGGQTTSSQASRPATGAGADGHELSRVVGPWPGEAFGGGSSSSDGDGGGGGSQGGSSGGGSLSPYSKLSKGDVGYGGNAFMPPANGLPGAPGAAEGLLSQRLRSLGVQGDLGAAAQNGSGPPQCDQI